MVILGWRVAPGEDALPLFLDNDVNAAIRANQQANHIQVLLQWADELEKLNRQLQQMQEQLAVQRRIRDVMGDPSAAGGQVVLRDLGANDLARTYGETLQAVRRLTNATASLRRPPLPFTWTDGT